MSKPVPESCVSNQIFPYIIERKAQLLLHSVCTVAMLNKPGAAIMSTYEKDPVNDEINFTK